MGAACHSYNEWILCRSEGWSGQEGSGQGFNRDHEFSLAHAACWVLRQTCLSVVLPTVVQVDPERCSR